MRNASKILIGKPNVKDYLGGIGIYDMKLLDFIKLAQDKDQQRDLVNAVIRLLVP
jgi:hypothetical protein